MSSLLVIEDDRREWELIQRKLDGRFVLDWAQSFKCAAARILTKTYDAILLDVGLPDSPQSETVLRMKAEKPGCAIVVLSGNSDPEFINRAIHDNASNYLVKGKDDRDGACLACKIETAISLNSACRQVDNAIQHLDSP